MGGDGGPPAAPIGEDPSHRAGFVAIVGLPGAGKSTLLNRLVGRRLAIVSGKPQTTRRRILGIARRPGVEIVLLDTPGVHRPKTRLGHAMMRAVGESLGGADVALAVVDATLPFSDASSNLLRRMARFPGPRVVGLNKADVASSRQIAALEAIYRERGTGEVLVFSARTGAGVAGPLVERLRHSLPFSPPLYEEGQITDLPEAFFASELVRERMLRNLRQEVPHAAAVRIEAYDDSGDLVRVEASVLLDRDSQRGIVIGRGGRMLKKIGTEARLALEKRLRRRVFLGLQVKVRRRWRDNPGILRDLGLDG